MKVKRNIFTLLEIGFKLSGIASILLFAHLCVQARTVRLHCEADKERVSAILGEISKAGDNLGDRIVAAAKSLEGIPLGHGADNDTVGTVMVNLHETDRLGFVNTVLALAQTSLLSNANAAEFGNQLVSYSRRKGQDEGFASKLFYGADWIVDNVYRGHLKEMTEYPGGGGVKTKTFDYLTRHRSDFPALADEATYDKVRMIEMGYRSHRVPHLKKQSASNKPLHEMMKNGDIIVMLSNEIDNDIYDIGFIEMRDGEPYLIHVSHETGKVVSDPYPLSRLFRLENQYFYGYRWLQPQ